MPLSSCEILAKIVADTMAPDQEPKPPITTAATYPSEVNTVNDGGLTV